MYLMNNSFLLDISAIESGDIGKVFGISSQAFALPSTDNNNEYFGNLYDIGATYPSGSLPNQVDSTPTNFTKSFPCQVLSDGQAIFSGVIYLDSIITDDRGDTIYNVVVANETIDFKYQITDKTFGDLDWSDYNHDLTYANITSSWDLNLFGGNVVYPLCEYGTINDDLTATMVRSGGALKTFTNTSSPLQVNDFKPAVRITTVLDKIFDSINYKYTSSFFESAYADTLYMLSTRDTSRGTSYVSPLEQNFYAYNDVPQTFSTFVPQVVEFNDEAFDNAGGFNNTTYKFTAVEDGQYSFDFFGSAEILNHTGGNQFRNVGIQLYINDVVSTVPGVYYNLFSLPPATLAPLTANFAGVNLVSGDTIKVVITFATNPTLLTEQLSLQGGQSLCYFQCYQSPTTILGGNVDLKGLFNQEEQILAFMNGLIQKFNLVIEPLKDNPKVLSIEPFNTWVDNGAIIDWTNKVDRSVKFEIKHPMGTNPNKILFSDVEDKDEYNQYSVRNFNKVFGSTVYQSESDLAEGEKKIGTYFAPTPMKWIQNTTDFIVPQIYVVNGESENRIAFKPRLLHYLGKKNANLTGDNGGTPTTNEWYFKDENGFRNVMTEYPQFHHLSFIPATETDSPQALDLHFNNPQHYEYHQPLVSAKTQRDAVYEYWSFYINELYDIDSRLLTLNVALKPTDIPNIQLNDRIFIDGHYYRINKITGANLTNEQSTKVELIKTLPRKTRYPRRRITDGADGIYDVYAGGIGGDGIEPPTTPVGEIKYKDWYTGENISNEAVVNTAGYRDGFFVYSGSIVLNTLDLPVPTTNNINGVNYVDIRANNVNINGSGNEIGFVSNTNIVGENNDINGIVESVNIFGNNVSINTTGTSSLEDLFIVNTNGPVNLTSSISSSILLNPVRPINEYQSGKVIIGNTLYQGALYETYNIVNVGPGSITYLTGSAEADNFHFHFVYSGANGTAQVFINDALLPQYDGLQQRFTTDGSLTASKKINITPVGGTIDGVAEKSLSTKYDGLTAQIINANWQVIQQK
jgi:hypothetical protein